MSEDLLSFKEYSPVHESHTHGGSAQINVNSPNRAVYGATITSTTVDPLQDLMDSMSTSINVIHSEDRQQRPPNPPNQPSGFGDENAGEGNPNQLYSIFGIEFYQKFFNVDTSMVRERIMAAIVPRRAPVNYLKYDIGSNPDLYGPIWIVITLVFSIAISGNIASYIQQASTNFHWRYNFHLVSLAATTIVMYVGFIPLILWAALKFTVHQNDSDLVTEEGGIYTPSLLSLICIYGYSLGIYIPVSMLWVIQISFLQWLLVIVAALSTGTVLVIILSPALQNSSRSPLLMGGILCAHFLLAAGFMLHFFHVPLEMVTAAAAPNIVPVAAANLSAIITS